MRAEKRAHLAPIKIRFMFYLSVNMDTDLSQDETYKPLVGVIFRFFLNIKNYVSEKSQDMPQYVLFVLTIAFSLSIFGDDTSSGRGGTGRSFNPIQNPIISYDCPKTLTNWVDEDFKDTTLFGLPKYSDKIPDFPNIYFFIAKKAHTAVDNAFQSEANICKGYINGYQKFLDKNNKTTNFQDSANLGQYLKDSNSKKVAPYYYDYRLKKCSDLPKEKATIIQTRFYAATERISDVNSAIVDEVSYYDSVLPSAPTMLSGVDCTPAFPDLMKKCSSYKKSAFSCGGNDKVARQKRLTSLVQKTKKNNSQINQLKVKYYKCLEEYPPPSDDDDFPLESPNTVGSQNNISIQEISDKKCGPIQQAIELLKNQTPWIRGKIFNDKLSKSNNNLDDKNIEAAIVAQLSANRQALANSYNSNLEDFKCLTVNEDSKTKSCDFKKLRSNLSKLPDPYRSIYKKNDSKYNEADSYVQAERCLFERGEDRQQTKSKIEDATIDAGVGLLTVGVGSVAMGGIKVVNTASRLVRGVTTAANFGSNAYQAGDSVLNAYKSCTKKTELVIELSAKSAARDNICSEPNSPLEQAREEENDCLVNSLLAATNFIPGDVVAKLGSKVSNKVSSAASKLSLFGNEARSSSNAIEALQNKSLADKKNLDNYLKKASSDTVSIDELNTQINKDGVDEFLKKNKGKFTKEEEARIKALQTEIAQDRKKIIRMNTDNDLESLAKNEKALTTEVDCKKLNALNTTDAFSKDARCAKVVFSKENNNYCACGRSEGMGGWLVPCAESFSEYLSPDEMRDRSSLPQKSRLQLCRRVGIPKGSLCFHGGIGPAFAGYGGGSQLYCASSIAKYDETYQKAIREGLLTKNESILSYQPYKASNIAIIHDNPEIRTLSYEGRICREQNNGLCPKSKVDEFRNRIKKVVKENPNQFTASDLTVFEYHMKYLEGKIRLDPKTGSYEGLSGR